MPPPYHFTGQQGWAGRQFNGPNHHAAQHFPVPIYPVFQQQWSAPPQVFGPPVLPQFQPQWAAQQQPHFNGFHPPLFQPPLLLPPQRERTVSLPKGKHPLGRQVSAAIPITTIIVITIIIPITCCNCHFHLFSHKGKSVILTPS
ncbi:hypothetical protein BP00DRAFT_2527 [Aspergillus indologenus CBS 114.80]|uniref:Uncharacterized protein n=1 Tax=Aspergillus indologenus CBS 114.80 TaxID=1450541 RepID=A0A2V5IKT5_9EURO|nr:hypothetical protein BP00DRAFT_2527 [Aspergillus indologenus CBS 114.80]